MRNRYLFIPLLLFFICKQTLAYGGRIIGEYEKDFFINSNLNPDNLIQLPSDKYTVATFFEDSCDVLNGKVITAFKCNFETLNGYNNIFLTTSKFPSYKLNIQINEIFYKQEFTDLSLSLGRKKIRWGVGYVYSPTDIITQIKSPEDPIDRLQNLQGTDLIQLSLLKENSQLDFIYFPKFEALKIINNNVGFRFYNYIEPYDISFVAKYEGNKNYTLGGNLASTIGDNIELHSEVILNTFNNKLYPNYLSNSNQVSNISYFTKNNLSYELLIGSQYTFQNNWNLTLEYLYFSNGYNTGEWKAYSDHLAYLYKEINSFDTIDNVMSCYANALNVLTFPMRQHYCFFRLYKNEVLKDITLDLSSILELTEFNGVQNLEIHYTMLENSILTFRVKYYFGNSKSEFGLVPNNFRSLVDFIYYF